MSGNLVSLNWQFESSSQQSINHFVRNEINSGKEFILTTFAWKLFKLLEHLVRIETVP